MKASQILALLNLVVLAGLLAPGCAGYRSGSGPHSAGSLKKPVGLQLYSLRNQFTRDVPSTLETVRGFGIKEVELAGTYNLEPAKFKALLQNHELKAVSGHFPYERFRDDSEGVARDAKALGLEYAGCAWITHEGDFDEPECRQAIAVFNHAGEVLARQGIKFFYHTHGYEFQRHGQGTLFDLLMAETKPQWVHYEMDVFWIIHPGQDPVKLLGRYPNRWELMHVKDMRKGTPTGLLTGHSDVTNDVAIGTGLVDWPSVLRAAERAGIKHYFIEDESPNSVTQIPQSLSYLARLRF